MKANESPQQPPRYHYCSNEKSAIRTEKTSTERCWFCRAFNSYWLGGFAAPAPELVLQVSATLSIFVTWIEGWLPEEAPAPLEVLVAELGEPEAPGFDIVPVTATSCPTCCPSFAV